MKFRQRTIKGHNSRVTHLTPLDKRAISEAAAWLEETGNQTAEVKTGRMKYHFQKSQIAGPEPVPVLLVLREWKESRPNGQTKTRTMKTTLELGPLIPSAL